jgi:hypothetical protein
MKVLSKGLWRHQFACEECGAVLMTEESDYKTKQIGRDVRIYCECSECETEYLIESKNMPEEIRLKIFNRPSKL